MTRKSAEKGAKKYAEPMEPAKDENKSSNSMKDIEEGCWSKFKAK